MPPKAKFSKEEITNAALEIVREKNWESLTARALGKKLGCSSCPIFTVFQNMDEVQQSVLEAARAVYKTYVEKGLSKTPAFKGVGTQYILFARNEPKLFQLLFMSEHAEIPELSQVLPVIDENYDKILASITDSYGLEQDEAEKLYRHLWIYCHGIATLYATKLCHFTGAEISEMMTEVFQGLMNRKKEEIHHDPSDRNQ